MTMRTGYLAQRTIGGVSYVDTTGAGPIVQWQLYAAASNALSLTTRDIVEDARTRHWSFREAALPDGALVRRLNTLQRELLLEFRDGLKGVVTRTVRTKAVVPTTGELVGVTPRGVPYQLSATDTNTDGYAVYLSDALSAPYIDMSGVPINRAPLTHGFPLPVEVISITAAKGTDEKNQQWKITVTSEVERTIGMPGRQLTAWASGNRMVASQAPGQPMASDAWGRVQYVELSFISIARVTNLCCLVTFPAVLEEALVAGLVDHLANQSRDCTEPERSRFVAKFSEARARLATASEDIHGELPTTHVRYMG